MSAFSDLTEKLQVAFKKLRGKGKLTEKDIDAALRDVRIAFLEADVNYKVVKDFIQKTKEQAMGSEVWTSLTPAQQVIKIVHQQLTDLMGGDQSKLAVAPSPPTIMMLVGLQGSGKTTTGGKMASMFKKAGRAPLLVAADVYRPAAVKQLQVVGERCDVPVFSMGTKTDPVAIAAAGIKHAKLGGNDPVIIDTAGRLQVDQELMQELERINAGAKCDEVLLVVDAMSGQDAVNVAEEFHRRLGLTGVILTKLDGDARGGAALSIKAVTGCPIKYVGLGEKLDALEPFYPDRMASRILGMGDVLGLIEKAQVTMDQEKAREMEKKLRENSFDLDDFLNQLHNFKHMGSLDEMLAMMPGVDRSKLKNIQVQEKDLDQIGAIIQSMTKRERAHPEILDSSRKRRVAHGSGTTVQDVNRLLRQFEQTQKLMQRFRGVSGKKGKKGMMGLGLPPF